MNKTKIFYVEDDETLAFLTTEALSNEGFQSIISPTGWMH